MVFKDPEIILHKTDAVCTHALSTILLAITFLAILAYQIISRHNRPQDD